MFFNLILIVNISKVIKIVINVAGKHPNNNNKGGKVPSNLVKLY